MKKSPEDLQREVESIRMRMTPIARELDHRRHALMDWQHQMKRRGPTVVKGIAALVSLITVARGVRKIVRDRRAGSAPARRFGTLRPMT